MGRVIKFRAWRPSNSSMMPANDLLQLLALSNENSLFNPDEVLWFQFTGMRDCDSVEMYENDIARVEGLGMCIVTICPNYGVIFDDLNGQHVAVIDCIAEQDKFWVVGNTHQHPELLK